MAMRLLIALTVIAALLAGCGGGESSKATPTSKATRTATAKTRTPAASPSAAAVPAKPAAFEDYTDTIAAYLTEAGDSALGDSCLEDLFADWQLPDPGGDAWPCLASDADGDSDEEVAVVLGDDSGMAADPMAGIVWQVVVFDKEDDAYQVAFASPPITTDPVTPATLDLLALADINDDGNAELVYTDTQCGAHTCFTNVHILSSTPSGFVSIVSGEISMAYADVSLDDTDGDGSLELLMHGGMIGSVGAGPQRERTEVYAWDGASYSLSQTTLDPTDILYLWVTEADALFNDGLYDQALALYQQALNDPTLQTWKDPADMVAPERPELEAYILFRMGLSSFGMSGPNAQGVAYIQQAAADYAGNLHGDLAGAFLASYQAKHNLLLACDAVDSFIASNLNLLEAFWEYGYANPTFDATAVCPF